MKNDFYYFKISKPDSNGDVEFEPLHDDIGIHVLNYEINDLIKKLQSLEIKKENL